MPKKLATELLELRGAFKAHPERDKRDKDGASKLVDPFPERPTRGLSVQEKRCWREIVAAVPAGVLTRGDVFQVEICARLLAELREVGREMPATRITRLAQELQRLGLSPAARAGLDVPVKPKENPFASL